MIKQSLYILLFLLSCLTVSCSRIDEFFGVEGGMSKTCKMVLHCSNPSYDQGLSRATGNSWEDEDEIYIYFTDGIFGVGKYDSSSDAWTFSYEGDLSSISDGSCVSYYTRGGSRSGTIVSLNEQTPVYADQDATYSFSNDCLTLSAEINPYSTRLRFMGDAGKSLVLKSGLKFYSSLDFSVNSFAGSEKEVSLEVSGDGYTHYVYCAPIEEAVSIVLSSGLDNYTRDLTISQISKGSSSLFSIPSREYHLGWNLLDPTEHEFVDLGLPSGTLWAACNIGASTPGDPGEYFAWGEIAPKDNYDWPTYIHSRGTYDSMIKYNTNTGYGFVDDVTVLDLEDDAALMNWGSKWRIPTKEQFDELKDNCSIEYVEDSSNGRLLVTGLNGNQIILPCAGKKTGSSIYNYGISAFYWTRDLVIGPCDNACTFYYNGEWAEDWNYRRHEGRSVRAVQSNIDEELDFTKIWSVNLNINRNVLFIGESLNIDVRIAPSTAINKTLIWDSSDPSVVTVNNGTVSAISSGTVTITATTADGSNIEKSCDLEVKAPLQEYVDLGLSSGRLWATCDIGAWAVGGDGYDFRWGEIIPSCNEPYKYGDIWSPEKYNDLDERMILEPEDDAATQIWGEGWRIPTAADFEELIKECRWTYDYSHENHGYNVIGPNGNSIFMSGEHWSSTLSSYYNGYSLYSYGGLMTNYRTEEYKIRPVFSSYNDIFKISKIALASRKSAYEGMQFTLTPSIIPEYATGTVIWESSDPAIASVEDGVVTAHSQGTATIKVQSSENSNVFATCVITVKQKAVSNFPVTDFMFNFNFKQYDAKTQTVPNDPAASWFEDLILQGAPVVHDGFISVNESDAYAQYAFTSCKDNPFNRNELAGKELTVIYKVGKTQGDGIDLLSNRGVAIDGSDGGAGHATWTYNWMIRPGQSSMSIHKGRSGLAEISRTSTETPAILYYLNDSDDNLYHALYDTDIVSMDQASYGANSGRICFFCCNTSSADIDAVDGRFSGEVYWMFVANRVLSKEEIKAVVEYNEDL